MAGFNDWLDAIDPRLLAEAIAERFRLSRNELTKVQEALAPAFALGLQRAMETPAAWGDLTKAFAAMVPGGSEPAKTGWPSSDWTKRDWAKGAWGDATALPKGMPGQAFVEAVFGSDALAGAVARQASMMAGIAPDAIQKLMPSLAMLAMETTMRASMAQMSRNAPQGLANGDIGSATAEMMRRGANAVEALSRPSSNPSSAAGASWDRPAQASPFGMAPGSATANPFADAMMKMMTTGLPWVQTPPDAPKPVEPAADRPAETFDPMLPFAAMFEAFARGLSSDAGTQAETENAGTRQNAKTGSFAGSPSIGETAAQPFREPAAPERTSSATATSVPPLAEGFVDDIVRSGQRLQEDYAKEMALLFERYPAAGRGS